MNIDILACGESINKYKAEDDIKIGINDVCRYIDRDVVLDYLVVVDGKNRFSEERLSEIYKSRYKVFVSQLVEWSDMKNFMLILLGKRNEYYKQLLEKKNPISISSPFVAVCFAYQCYKPDTITLWGVDFVTHEKLSGRADKIKKDFAELRDALTKLGCKIQLGINYGILNNILEIKK